MCDTSGHWYDHRKIACSQWLSSSDCRLSMRHWPRGMCDIHSQAEKVMSDDIDWTPPTPTSRVPIFCQVCRKQGRVDRDRQTITGAMMPLLDFLADKPRVCAKCARSVSIVRAKS